MTTQTPLPGEPGVTVDELGGTTPGRLTPGPTADARRDDLGSGPYGGGAGVDAGGLNLTPVPASPFSDLPGYGGEEVGGAGPGVPGSGRVEPAEVATPGEQEPVPPALRCCSCRDIEDDADPGCVLHGRPAPDPAVLARIYDLGVRGLALARAEGDEIRCWHCDRVIAADEELHVHADGGQARPVCDSCDAMEGDR